MSETQRLKKILRAAQEMPGLARRGPRVKPWNVELSLVSRPRMTRINAQYRGKNQPTDVLSFPAPETFRSQGILGELIICAPVLRAQARERGLTAEMELHILLAHGVLHLLGFDHERGSREAAAMVRWEQRLLEATVPKTWVKESRGRALAGLIERTRSGI